MMSAPELPPLGLGTAGIGNLYRSVSDEDAQKLLTAAWDAGIRYFDTAPFYGSGRAEERLGRFLSHRGDAVIVSTKVGRVLDPADPQHNPDQGFADPLPFVSRFDYGRDGILRSFEGSVARLGRVPDIVLIHDIGERTHGAERNCCHLADLRFGGFRALEELRAQGVRAVGIGVNEVEIGLQLLKETRLDVILLAGRHTLLDRGASSLFRRAEALGTAIIAAGVYNSGILATGSARHAKFDYASAPRWIHDRVERLEQVAARHRLPLSALAVQFPSRDPAVSTVLLGATSAAELASSLSSLARAVPAAAWAEVEEALADSR
jgi:D-threo-aldose 1-dehydrogenase